jgi:hypothetical protein
VNVVYRYRDGVFECPLYAKRGEKLSVKQYDDEWGCRIGKAFVLGDTPHEAIENTLRYLGDTPINAETQVTIETGNGVAAPTMSEEERTATMARIESLQQSIYSGNLSPEATRETQEKLEREQRKLK